MMNLTQQSGDQHENGLLSGTDESQLSAWIAAYPTASRLLAALDCPSVFDLVVGKSQWAVLGRDALSHWIQLGRPEVSWQDAVEWECVQLFCKRLSIPLPSRVQSFTPHSSTEPSKNHNERHPNTHVWELVPIEYGNSGSGGTPFCHANGTVA